MHAKTEDRQQRLIVVSNRLPVSLERDDGGYIYNPSVGGLATTLNAVREEMDMLWLGVPGIHEDNPEQQAKISNRLSDEFGSVPIFLPRKQFDLYYNGFSNGSIWPLFHYFPQYAHYDHLEWQAYQEVNARFCEKVLEVALPGDTIWVHDYHLLLLPAMLRESLPDAAIGFFLHIPFPSYEIFRMIPWREEILEGLTGADLVGFHTYDYARHFLSSLLRIQGLEQDFGRVTVGDRAIKVDTFPLGVDINRYSTAHEMPEVKHELEALRQQVGEHKVILTVDRLDFSKGIIQRLNAFEKFLSRHPDWLGRVTMLSLLVPSRTRVPEYQNLKSQVDELIGRINGQLSQPGWAPITYLYRSVPFEQLIALYLMADVTLVTPLRDGMNLVAKEYLISRPDGTGVLVLSETAGAAAELGEAIIVNPHNEEMLVEALHQALEMPLEEQEARNATMRARLRRYDTERWADDFLSQLARVQEVRRLHLPKRLQGKLKQELLQAYEGAERRLLLLDYDGTLVPFAPTPKRAKPDEELIAVLTPLACDPKNTMVIISGRDAETLDAWLGEVGMDLVAEHGATVRRADKKQWEQVDEDFTDDWKEQLKPVFEMFVDRTPGALLEEKGAALVWHYRRADPGLGSQRAVELIDTIEGYIANTSLHILQGHKVVEVKPSTVSKGRAAQPWLSAKPPYDFILAVGDDVTDEALFEVIPESGWTVKIGVPERSKARYFLSDPAEVRSLLKELS